MNPTEGDDQPPEKPVQHGALDPKSRALISLGVAAAVTTLDHLSIGTAVRKAAAAGATREEALEVLELVSVLGVHTLAAGFPILAQILEDNGQTLAPARELSAGQMATRDAFTAKRGYWSGLNEIQLRVDPRWFGAYTAFSSPPVAERSARAQAARADLYRHRPVPDASVHR